MVYKKTELEGIVSAFIKEIKKKISLKKVIIFGSYAYGKPANGSDIDIAVVSDAFKKMDDIKRIMLLSDSARKIKTAVDIDPIGFTEEELEKADYFDIGALIREQGVVVYKSAAKKRSLICRV